MLLNKKKVLSKTVFERIPKEQLPESALEDPAVRRAIKQLGYYEVAYEISPNQKEILNELVKLGYVEKRVTRVHKVWLNHITYLYYPDINDLGNFTLDLSIQSASKYAYIEDEQLEAFQSSIERFQKEMTIGHHPHVKELNYGIEFSYLTDVYELKDKYFDAILLGLSKDKLTVALVEPYIVSRVTRGKRRDYKKWRVIRKIDGDLFLKGSSAIDKYIDELEWKKEADGFLIIDDSAYILNPRNLPKKDSLLDRYPIIRREIENLYSYEFEGAVADFIREKYGYNLVVRNFSPPYLDGKELDIYAVKFGDPRRLTLVECKLRIYDENNPITYEEVERAKEIMQKIEEYERDKANKEGDRLKTYKWIFTNSRTIESRARELLKESKIEVKRAILSSNWLRNPRALRIINIENLN